MTTSMNVNLEHLNEQEKFELVFKHPYALGNYMVKAIKTRKSKLYK